MTKRRRRTFGGRSHREMVKYRERQRETVLLTHHFLEQAVDDGLLVWDGQAYVATEKGIEQAVRWKLETELRTALPPD